MLSNPENSSPWTGYSNIFYDRNNTLSFFKLIRISPKISLNPKRIKIRIFPISATNKYICYWVWPLVNRESKPPSGFPVHLYIKIPAPKMNLVHLLFYSSHTARLKGKWHLPNCFVELRFKKTFFMTLFVMPLHTNFCLSLVVGFDYWKPQQWVWFSLFIEKRTYKLCCLLNICSPVIRSFSHNFKQNLHKMISPTPANTCLFNANRWLLWQLDAQKS